MRAFVVFAAVTAMSADAAAQARQPVCEPVSAQRIANAPALLDFPASMTRGGLVVAPLRGGDAATRYVVAFRDDAGAARATGEASAAYTPDAAPLTSHAPSLAVLRVGDPLTSGPASRVALGTDPDPTPIPLTAASVDTAVVIVATLPTGVFAVLVPPTGPIAAPTLVAPPPVAPDHFAWSTALSRDTGAVALIGTESGQVTALRFDRTGALVGHASQWTRRVGGPMQLVPTPGGPIAALLGRPVPGTAPHDEIPRVQVLVTLDERLDPLAADPANTGFAQFPIASFSRGHYLTVIQWALEHGVAIATLPIGERRIGEQLPRIWEAQPLLEGALVSHDATLAPGNIIYDVVAYRESADGIRAHLVWLPPSGEPVILRDVLPLRGHLVVGAPRVLPAADGVVVITAGIDETGFAVDAWHVHCDLAPTR